MTVISLSSAIFSLLFMVALTLAPPAQSQTNAVAETSNLAVETIRQAIFTGRARIAGHPREPQNYIDLAYTLVDAGITEQAAQLMQKATEIAPQSAFVYHAQGWVLHHNSIGVEYGKGFDYDGASAAYRKAIALDPNNLSIRKSLAEILQYNHNGVRYAPDAKMDEAIDILRFVKAHESGKDEDPDVEDDLLISLFYAGRFSELLPELQGFSRSSKRDGITLAAIAALKGSALALERANQTAEEDKRKEALTFAAEGLWNMRLYSQAADLLTASLPDLSGSNRLLGQIQIFRNLEPYKGADLPATDPRSPVQRLIVSAATDTLTEDILDQCVSRHSFASDEERKRSLPQANFFTGRLHTLSRQTGLPQVVVQDIVLNQIKITSVPSKGQGVRVVVQAAGLLAANFFVLNEDGAYKIVAGSEFGNAGTEALFLLHHNQETMATALLDWKRDLSEKNQGDDPLGGLLFARLWTPRQGAQQGAAELAAASLITDKSTLLGLLPFVVEARKSATADGPRNNCDLLLASMYLRLQDGVNATLTTQQLLAHEPDSATAISLMGRAYALTKDWGAWTALLDRQMQQHPNDRLILLQVVEEAEARGDFARARDALRTVLDSGHALPDDNNNYAWLALVDDNVDDLALQAAEQANLATRNGNSAYLHTLACLYAARGQTALARQFLLDSMSVSGTEEPTSVVWYGFGRIYEQYRVTDAALAAYRRVNPSSAFLSPTDTYALAQRRLHLLQTQ